MIEELRDTFTNLDTYTKRKILLDEVLDTCLTIEKICKKKKIDINSMKSSEIIIKKADLKDKEFLDLLFLYIFYLKEDLGLLLKDL